MLEVRVDITGDDVVGEAVWLSHWAGEDGSSAEAARSQVNDYLELLPGYTSPGITYTISPEVLVIDPATGTITAALSTVTSFDAVTGTAGGDVLPLATQGLVHVRTGTYLAGREVRGRINVPGPTELLSTAGAPTAGYTGGIQTAANALLAGVGFGVWSRAHGQFVQASSVSVWPKWAVLRSRRD